MEHISAGSRWQKYEEQFLKFNYYTLKKKHLVKKLGRTWVAIKLRARMLGLSRGHNFRRNSNMGKLLGDSRQAYYWIGFLLADGCFYHNVGRIGLCIHKRDADHILSFSHFVGSSNIHHDLKRNQIGISFQNKELFYILTKKFDIKHRKTFNPPTNDIFNGMSDDLFLSLIMGFIDGDGTITKRMCISIKIHSSWFDFLCYVEDRLYRCFGFERRLGKRYEKRLTRIDATGYAKLILSDMRIVNALKKESNKIGICLARKWNKINENRISMYDIAERKRSPILEKLSKGITDTSIIMKQLSQEQTEFAYCSVYVNYVKLNFKEQYEKNLCHC